MIGLAFFLSLFPLSIPPKNFYRRANIIRLVLFYWWFYAQVKE